MITNTFNFKCNKCNNKTTITIETKLNVYYIQEFKCPICNTNNLAYKNKKEQ